MSSETPTAAGPRVATIPFGHLYAEAALPPGVLRVGPDLAESPWLDGDHLAAHAPAIDVLHVHGGFDHLRPAHLECWAETVRRVGVPLVVTVHVLGDAEHDARLEAILGSAEVVLTLTPGAADEIALRFGRTAIVVAHPSPAAPEPGLGAERGLVGLVLGEPTAPGTRSLVRAAHSGAVSGGGRLRVLADPGSAPRGVRALAAREGIELVEALRGGPGWAAELQQLHAAVLPERPGTHSRDLEICRDVGTAVVAPRSGWFADQWAEVLTYAGDAHGPDPVSLTAALAAVLTRPMPRPADRAWREEQRAAAQRVHAQIYAQVAADRVLG